MKRILFVDDEAHVLDGIRRALRGERRELDMTFANSAEEALALCEEQAFDIVVSDMKMPGMSGADLLEKLHEQHPKTARFILSGYSDMEAVMRTVPVAHQFMTKPCRSAELRETVISACNLQEILEDERLLTVVGEVDSLPSRPECYSRVLTAIADPNMDLGYVASIIEQDVAMSGKLLQLANSAFFGVAEEISSVEQAATYLGLNTIRDLVLSLEVFKTPAGSSKELESLLGRLHERSARVAAVAKGMFDDKRSATDAFTAGILHDVGTLILATKVPEDYERVLEQARSEGIPVRMAEERILGVSHAEVGAHLLSLWGLPYPIIASAAYHHAPSAANPTEFNEVVAIHVAAALIEARSSDDPCPIDLELLETLGVAERLEDFEALADEAMEANLGGGGA